MLPPTLQHRDLRWLVGVLICAGLAPFPDGQAFGKAPSSAQAFAGDARWIAATADDPTPAKAAGDGQTRPAAAMPIFRRSFQVQGKPTQATLLISGLGQYEAHVNGQNVTTALLTPTWTDPRKRVFYGSFDVTRLLVPGENVLGVMLGNGMYNVQRTAGRYTKFIGSFGQPKLLATLRLRFSDGTEQTVGSDAEWRSSPGPIIFSSTYGGEDFDARLEQPGWDGPGFQAAGWLPALGVAGPGGRLEAEFVPPVEAFERYEPISVTHPTPSVTVYDLGQNFAGWPEIEVMGARGSSVKLIGGELLDAVGRVTQRSAAASPKAQNSFTYTLAGGGAERWHPRFSYYGFRFLQVETSGEPAPVVSHVAGRFLHDAAAVDGQFTSSNELLNRIHLLITRAMLSNMVGVLTDCPHREKLGWLEQSHLAAASLMFNFDLRALYRKIGEDMEDAQTPEGLVPNIAPEFTVFPGDFRDSPEWGAAAILSPWAAFQFYGDVAPLRAQYDSMRRYAAYLKGRTQDHLLFYGLGDWYDLGPRPPGRSQQTERGVTASAIYFQSLTTLAKIATLLGHAAEARAYTVEAGEVREAFNAKFFHAATNQYASGSQTSNSMPLVTGLVPDERRAAVLGNLVADIRAHGNHVTAGDVGFHYVVRALTDGGRSDVLYDMLSRTDKPSYGDQIAHGATTLTEAWDANPGSSQNHLMLGHAEEWFFRGLAGIDFDMSREAAERILIRPAIVGDVRSASGSYVSVLGKVESAWALDGKALHMHVSIPAGAHATIRLPAGAGSSSGGGSVRVNGRRLSEAETRSALTGYVVSGGTYDIDIRP